MESQYGTMKFLDSFTSYKIYVADCDQGKIRYGVFNIQTKHEGMPIFFKVYFFGGGKTLHNAHIYDRIKMRLMTDHITHFFLTENKFKVGIDISIRP